jgi:hypothetical protein
MASTSQSYCGNRTQIHLYSKTHLLGDQLESSWDLGFSSGSIQPLIEWVPGGLPLGVKRQWREADHSPPSNAEVENAWSYTSTPQYFFMAWCSVKAQGQLYLYLLNKSHRASSRNDQLILCLPNGWHSENKTVKWENVNNIPSLSHLNAWKEL